MGRVEPHSSLNVSGKLALGDVKNTSFELRQNAVDKTYSLNIASLARIIGPSSKLNPLLLSGYIQEVAIQKQLELLNQFQMGFIPIR